MRYEEQFLEEQFQKLLSKIDSHYMKFANQNEFEDDPIIENARFIELMGISTKLAQSWRDKKIISYSQVNGKIFYRKSDVIEMLNKYHVKSSKPEQL
jgi:hypothetical protein